MRKYFILNDITFHPIHVFLFRIAIMASVGCDCGVPFFYWPGPPAIA
jgi:hypothetical protein